METRDLINERERRYGTMEANAACTWALMEVFQRFGFNKFTFVQKHLLYMTAHKMARMLCGDSTYIDNYDDIIGYWTRARDYVPRAKPQELTAEEVTALETHIVQQLALEEPIQSPGTPEDGGHHASFEEEAPEEKLRDGVKTRPRWKHVMVTSGGQMYYLADRDHYSEGAIEELPRLLHVINHAEHQTLPPYYRPLYERNELGGFNLKSRYVAHWGVK